MPNMVLVMVVNFYGHFKFFFLSFARFCVHLGATKKETCSPFQSISQFRQNLKVVLPGIAPFIHKPTQKKVFLSFPETWNHILVQIVLKFLLYLLII